MSRYVIYDGGKVAHSCFDATVMDSAKPEIVNGEHYEDAGGKHYEVVCECYDMKDAELICDALNKQHVTNITVK